MHGGGWVGIHNSMYKVLFSLRKNATREGQIGFPFCKNEHHEDQAPFPFVIVTFVNDAFTVYGYGGGWVGFLNSMYNALLA